MHIIGTAGHVDHGKSALVIALTGHNPDRFIEERERGMTLDLGFAPLSFPDGVDAGIIDVPGHERFLHNMLAGAAGMELLLLVVAANEGPRPQTYDHLHILNFLNVRRAIIVLTKRDLVSDDDLAAAAALAREACKGTVAESADVIPVSSLTGAGIDDLKRAIHDALAALPPREPNAPAYLPVDRVFALPGHGTIVTGTLMQGTIAVGDTLALQPSGLPVRIRSVQTFGRSVERATGGARVAVNLPGIEVGAVRRGETLAAAREFVPADELRIEFTPLAASLRLLKRRTPVRAHIGSAEVLGHLIFEGEPPRDARATPARLLLQRPVVFFEGSRLIVRRMSPKDLLGGAVATSLRSASRREQAEGAERRAAGDGERGADSHAARVLDVIGAAGLTGADTTHVAAALNVVAAGAQREIDALLADGRVVALTKPVAYVASAASAAGFERAASFLEQRSRAKPWVLGAPARDIATALDVAEPLADRLLHAWHDDGRIAQTARRWHLPDAAAQLTPQQRAFFETALRDEPNNALLPASYDDIVRSVRAQRIAGLDEALETLLATGGLVRIGDDLYRRAQIERARAAVVEVLTRSGGATMSQIRDAFGTSRRYALPLMEHFDGIGLTVRDGDVRRLRKAGHPVAS